MPHTPYHVEQPKNWPLIILITIAAIILISFVVYFIINKSSSGSDSNSFDTQGADQGIAVGEPNPNGYDCTEDIYNCDNFTTQSEAQVAFDSCFEENGDVWNLDNDGDGRVCEGMG